MNRRELMFLLGGAVTAPHALRAQQKAMPVIGYLNFASPGPRAAVTAAFLQGLNETGFVEGQNLAIEYRWAEGRYDRLPALAADLVSRKVDVIVAAGPFPAIAAKSATSTIPIIFIGHADPVGTGHVTRLARPGGNITGLSLMMTETSVKSLELFTQAVPGLARVAVIFDPATPSHTLALKAVEAAGPLLGLQIQPMAVRSATEYDSAFLAIVQGRADAVLVLTTPLFIAGAQRLAELALTHKLPSVGSKYHTEAGGLMSYWPNRNDYWRRTAIYVDKILKGANPADLPVQQPTKFELVVNLKTADALGLTIPRSILALADEVIE